MITLYDFGNSVCCQEVRRVPPRARKWPSCRRGLYDLTTPAGLVDMQTHGPKIRDDVAARCRQDCGAESPRQQCRAKAVISVMRGALVGHPNAWPVQVPPAA